MKKPTVEDLAKSAWAAALAPKHECDTVPEGWFTAIQLGKLLGKDRSTVTNLLKLAIAEGRCEVKRFRVPSGQRGIYPTPHYKLVGK